MRVRRYDKHVRTGLASERADAPDRRDARAGVRARVLAYVEARPGASPSDVVRSLGIGWSSLYRHVKTLRELDLVRVVASGRHAFLYPQGAPGAERHAVQRAALLNGRARLVAAEAAARPGQDVASLARALGISPRVVYHHVKRLVAVGLLASSLPRRYRDLAPTESLRALLREVGP